MTEYDDDEARPLAFTRLDGTVVLLTATFWTINAIQLSARSLISPSEFNQMDGVMLARLASLMTGILLTLGMWIILRRLTEPRAFAWFWRAAALGLVVCLIHTVLNATYFRVLTDYHASSGEFFLHPRNVISTYISFLWPIMTWSALCAVMVAGDNLRRQQARTAEAQAVAQQAQLAALRLQIQPHFLFNTLNSASSLIGQGRAQEADRILVQLADFLKHTLAAVPRELVRLEIEIDSQGRYLDIEEIRFPDRLSRRLLLEPEAMGAMVPSLILQPFVENAIKHGLAHSVVPVTLEVGARRDGERLKLWVSDDGSRTATTCTSGLGRSLANAGRRLHLLYGPEASLRYGPGVEGGWRVDVELPFEVAA
ncbi:histidine kinase [Brevundimonas sp.]|uniref:sensor histidine kinase n=1 Tax=Brevundimonas sp. TaxID=1871086 RepID=UPI002FC96B62